MSGLIQEYVLLFEETQHVYRYSERAISSVFSFFFDVVPINMRSTEKLHSK